MSFDNVQLPASTVADLYKQNLVVLNDVQVKAKRVSKNVINQIEKESQSVKTTAPIEVEKVIENLVIPVVEPEPVKPVIKFLGGFKKAVSIVISEAVEEYINKEDLEFLKKMMAACKLTIDDMAIINVVTNQPAAEQLWQLMPAKVVLMFGVSTSSIGIPFYQPDFKVQHWDSAQFMNAPSLATFRSADTPEVKALKRELWSGLQKIFLEK